MHFFIQDIHMTHHKESVLFFGAAVAGDGDIALRLLIFYIRFRKRKVHLYMCCGRWRYCVTGRRQNCTCAGSAYTPSIRNCCISKYEPSVDLYICSPFVRKKLLHLKMRPAIVFLSIDVNQYRFASFLIIKTFRIKKLKSFPNESGFECYPGDVSSL